MKQYVRETTIETTIDCAKDLQRKQNKLYAEITHQLIYY